jgi:hypothetical protein
MRTLTALFAAGLAPAVVFCLACIAIDPAGFAGWFGIAFPVALLASLAHALLLGLPAVLALKSRNALRWWTIILAGFAIGLLPSLVTLLLRGELLQRVWWWQLRPLLELGGLGAVGALAFWLIWRRPARLGIEA